MLVLAAENGPKLTCKEDSADPVFKELCEMVGDTKKASKDALDALLEPHMRGQLSR